MEPNTIFWLEFRQAKRNGMLLALLVLGIFAQFLAYLLLPVFFGWKIASQRLNEDMILYTPLSPYQILNGKILFGLLCGIVLFTPSLIIAFFFAATGDFLWIFCEVNGFLNLQCNIVIVTSFMAGAKSQGKMITLVFLLGVFGLTRFVITQFIIYGNLTFALLYYFFAVGILLTLLAAVFAYFVGISGLSSNLNKRKAIAWSLAGIFAICFVAVFGYSLSENFSYNSLYVTVALFFYFCPLIAAASLGGIFQVNSGK